MIDVKELRIGSHVVFEGERVKVRGIGVDFVRFDGECVFDHEIYPIPITAELLAELGFRKQPHSTYSQFIGDYAVHLYGSEDVDFMIAVKHISEGEIYRLYPAHYLHELEAMYYHVFKKELIEE